MGKEFTSGGRIDFLDLMRFFALFMMIQGHTVYAVLEHSIRDGDSLGIEFWRFFRGYTAPVFMTISGAVFTYLLVKSIDDQDGRWRRLKRGWIRVGVLFFWGYFLRLPIDSLWTPLSQGRLDVAMAMDVLQLIGFGLLTIMLVFSFERRSVTRLLWIFGAAFLAIAYLSPIIGGKNVHRQEVPYLSYDFLGVELVDEEEGVVVSRVRPESRATDLGLQVGDEVRRLGRSELLSVEELLVVEGAQRVGGDSRFKLVRDGEDVEIPWSYERPSRVWPNVLTMWLNEQRTPAGKKSLFPVFPWVSYLLFGAFLGTWLAWIGGRSEAEQGLVERWLWLKLLVAGVVFLLWAKLGDWLERGYLGASNFWGDVEGLAASQNLVIHRIGGVLVLAAVMALIAKYLQAVPAWINRLTRNTLWLYVGHLIILYWIRPYFYRGKFEVLGTLVCVLVMFGLMYGQSCLIEYKRRRGGWAKILKRAR